MMGRAFLLVDTGHWCFCGRLALSIISQCFDRRRCAGHKLGLGLPPMLFMSAVRLALLYPDLEGPLTYKALHRAVVCHENSFCAFKPQ
jgi:hypothetical protein